MRVNGQCGHSHTKYLFLEAIVQIATEIICKDYIYSKFCSKMANGVIALNSTIEPIPTVLFIFLFWSPAVISSYYS